eukprot:CAMPEP_0172567428 /NCGR_PEP_ID=MMETSP1067-20121228/115869_1 /TAXON_ID=265564 ORGANISM="Thalassiosira punctigera, Strain Tpunct2005C2" /NCGR_SAMPLE_ID=MMETSP1067 /ASSEMBLY_ACC=CAM_ASM_000444 /LENGTH=537 /DNA_ID=CAMNT_0013358777 /DNA_START=139 /DNA_END=1752 /DNA_ORIENTATION=+
MAAPAPPRSPFEALPRHTATSILSYVASDDWLDFRLASRSSFEIVHGGAAAGGDEGSESLWRLALVRDYGFGGADDDEFLHRAIRTRARGGVGFLSTDDIFTAPNLFISWKHWRRIDVCIHPRSIIGYGRPRQLKSIPRSETIVGPHFLRAASMWRKIEQWCDDEERSGTLGREIKSSLLPGKPLEPNSDGGIRIAKTSAFKAVNAFYSGQRDPRAMHATAAQPRDFNPFSGLFGGFQAYNVISSMRWTEPDLDSNHRCGGEPIIIIAQGEMKAIVMEIGSGQLYFLSDGNMARKLVATPAAGEIDRRTIGGRIHEEYKDAVDSEDSILRWFEEHADRLHRNFYSVGNIIANIPGNQTLHSILRYPTLADTANCSRAVTRGVEVVASAIFVPEMGMFVYSIRMRLLAPEDGDGYVPPEERGFRGCQLLSRHWRIGKSSPNSDEHSVEEVRGEGVIGFYPLLHEGGYTNYEDGEYVQRPSQLERGTGYFSYQSCTGADSPGFLEGSLQFRPGSLAEPSGDVFDVRVARFPLKFSQFLY